MAQVTKCTAKVEMKSPATKVYNFFKNNATQWSQAVPHMMKRSELIEGELGHVGNVIVYDYLLGGMVSSMAMKTTAINDNERSITMEVIEGEILKMYPTYTAKMRICEGFLELTIESEKANESVPNLDSYVQFAADGAKGADAYILTHG